MGLGYGHWFGLVLVLFSGNLIECRKRAAQLSNDLELPEYEEDLIPDDTNVGDPRGQNQEHAYNSWVHFMRHSDTQESSGKRTKKHQRRFEDVFPDVMSKPGPPGPPGPPGANVTTDVIMKLFKDLVNEEAERKTERLLAMRCPGCPGVRNETLGLLEAGELDILPRVLAGFHQSLTDDIKVKSRSLTELTGFIQPFVAGSFDRGGNFVSRDGHYVPPRSGVYQLVVNLHIHHRGYRGQAPRKLRRSEQIRILVCMQARCKDQPSLVYTTGLESNSSEFSVNFSGILFLKKDVYISVFVENTSRRQIVVLAGSTLMGSLLGT